ncbi:MAG: hypothetical protein ACYC6L_12040, partial [Anaerolineae bacterium]
MAIMRRMFHYLKPHLRLLALLLFCMVVGLGVELFMPRTLSYVIDRGITQRSMANVLRYTGLLAVLAVVRASLRYGQMTTQERLGQETIRGLRHDL